MLEYVKIRLGKRLPGPAVLIFNCGLRTVPVSEF
jgi:hypothetical protein